MISRLDLIAARKLKGWTQAQLADALMMNQKTITNWESQRSDGVPGAREHEVRRVLGPELLYVRYAEAAGPRADDFATWSAASESTSAALDEALAKIDAGLFQQKHKLTVSAAPRVLIADASDDQLLEELLDRSRRRELISTRKAMRALRDHPGYTLGDVGGPVDDDLHKVDLAQESFDLAASEDDSFVDPDRGA